MNKKMTKPIQTWRVYYFRNGKEEVEDVKCYEMGEVPVGETGVVMVYFFDENGKIFKKISVDNFYGADLIMEEKPIDLASRRSKPTPTT
jgi:hypothetical protein